mgnify:CR=1 FL=1
MPTRVASAAPTSASSRFISAPTAMSCAHAPHVALFNVSVPASGREYAFEANTTLGQTPAAGGKLLVELLDDQAEPFAAVSTGICDAGVCAGEKIEISFPVDIDMRAALLPEFGDLEQGTTCACRVAVRRVVDKQLDYRTPDEKKAIIGDRMRARAVKDAEMVAVALLRTAAQDALGPDWARDENLAEDAVPAFLLKNCDVRWVDA